MNFLLTLKVFSKYILKFRLHIVATVRLEVNSVESDQTAPSVVGFWMPPLQIVMGSILICVQTVCLQFKIIRLFQQKLQQTTSADHIFSCILGKQ